MSSVAVEHIQTIQEILAQQRVAPRPSPAICANIAALRDLCELGAPQVEWRRQESPSAPYTANTSRTPFKGSPSGQPFNRTTSAFSLGSVGSESPTSPAPVTPGMKKSGGGTPRYQSQFKNSSQPVEDKILNNIILSKLNKFCPSTYVDTREFLYQILGSGESDLSEMVRQFMLLVFKKAASEEIYCSLYAKLLSEISQRYKVILEEMNTLQKNYLAIFDEVEEKKKDEEYTTFVEKNIEKKYRQGYSQFISELSMLEIIELSHLEETFRRIFDAILTNADKDDKTTLVEEYIDCLMRMSRVCKINKSAYITSAKEKLMAILLPVSDKLNANRSEYPSFSAKARFILMDVKDNLT